MIDDDSNDTLSTVFDDDNVTSTEDTVIMDNETTTEDGTAEEDTTSSMAEVDEPTTTVGAEASTEEDVEAMVSTVWVWDGVTEVEEAVATEMMTRLPCEYGLTGKNCEIALPCFSNPCDFGFECVPSAGQTAYTCMSMRMAPGTPCSSGQNPCGLGTCVDHSPISYICDCSNSGYEGVMCQIEINECLSMPCGNGGLCHDDVNGYRCSCPAGYQGSTCLQKVDTPIISSTCTSNPCFNGGTCIDRGTWYTCTCRLSYEGLHCQTRITATGLEPDNAPVMAASHVMLLIAAVASFMLMA